MKATIQCAILAAFAVATACGSAGSGLLGGPNDGGFDGGLCPPGANCQIPSCDAGQYCARLSSGSTCLPACPPDAGTPCAAGQECKLISGCCVGTACTAIAVPVCCAPGQC